MTQSLLSKSLFLTVAFISLAAPLQAQLSGTDNFNDNSKDTSKWGTDAFSGGATLVEANGRLEYRVASPDLVNDFDEAKRPWVLNTARNSDAFDVLLDVFNNVTPSGLDNASIGITVTSLQNADDSIYVELYRSGPSADGSGFLSALDTSVLNAEGDHEVLPRTTPSPHSAVTTGSVRLNYNPTAKLFTAYYDPDGSSNGYQWQEYGSFGVGAAGGGSKRNGLWQLSNNLGFQVSVSGFSERLTVASGSVYADNLSMGAVPQMSVEQLGVVNIANGGSTSGAVTVGTSTDTVFTIHNTGSSNLLLSGTPKVVVSGTDADLYTITQQPASPVQGFGGTTTFTVHFAPTTTGIKTATLAIANNDSSQGTFVINLTGLSVPTAASNSFASRVSLGSTVTADVSSNNTGATLEAGESTFGGIGGASVWYQWTAPTTGWVTVHTAGSPGDTVLGLFTGTTLAGLTELGHNDDSFRYADFVLGSDASGPSRLVFYAQAGTSYQIVFQGYVDSDFNLPAETGDFQLHIAPEPAPPFRVTAFTLTPNTANVTNGSLSVIEQISVASDTPLAATGGVFSVQLLRPDASERGPWVSFSSNERIAGNDSSGTYLGAESSSTTAWMPQYALPGNWSARVECFLNGEDYRWTSPGNDLVDDNYILPPAASTTLNVINTGIVDSTPPTLVSVSGVPATAVDVGGGAVTFNLVLNITDALSGFSYGFVSAKSASTGDTIYLPSIDSFNHRTSGNQQSGTYTVPVTIPAGTANGTYYIALDLNDVTFNRSDYTDNPAGEPRGTRISAPGSAGVTFQVTGGPNVPGIAVELPAGSNIGGPEVATVPIGSAVVGQSISRTFTVRNSGTADLSGLVLSPDIAPNAGDFAIGALGATTLAPGATTTFTVTFTPAGLGTRYGGLRIDSNISSNDGNWNPFFVLLSGTGTTSVPTVTSVTVGKSIGYMQTSAASVVVNPTPVGPAYGGPYGFSVNVDGQNVSALSTPPTVTGPFTAFHLNDAPELHNGGILLYNTQDGVWRYGSPNANDWGSPTLTDLDARFGSGTYTITVGSASIPLTLTGDIYPNITSITLSGGVWSDGKYYIDPAAVLTVTTNTFTAYGSHADDAIFSGIEGIVEHDVFASSSPGTNFLSYQVAANTLTQGQEYYGWASFAAIASRNNAALAGSLNAAYYERDTAFTLVAMSVQQSWRQTYFGITTNTGNAANTATPMNDGITNLLKYATGMNPTQSGRMPGSVTKSGSNILFTYPRSKTALASGVTYTVEWSDTLAGNSWSNTGVTENAVDQGSTDQVTATMPAGANGRRFVHLKITPAP